jgi:hypothetical protein
MVILKIRAAFLSDGFLDRKRCLFQALLCTAQLPTGRRRQRRLYLPVGSSVYLRSTIEMFACTPSGTPKFHPTDWAELIEFVGQKRTESMPTKKRLRELTMIAIRATNESMLTSRRFSIFMHSSRVPGASGHGYSLD